MTKFFGDEPPAADVPEDYDSFESVRCPACDSVLLEYFGEAYDDAHHMGSSYRCDDCGLRFTEESARDGTWE